MHSEQRISAKWFGCTHIVYVPYFATAPHYSDVLWFTYSCELSSIRSLYNLAVFFECFVELAKLLTECLACTFLYCSAFNDLIIYSSIMPLSQVYFVVALCNKLYHQLTKYLFDMDSLTIMLKIKLCKKCVYWRIQ